MRAVVLVALAACTDTVALDRDQLVALEISPPASTIAITDLDAPATLDVVATGSFADGSVRPIAVDWNIVADTDTPAIGTIDAGRFQTTNTALGDATLRASTSDLVATAVVRVRLALVIVDPAAPPSIDLDAPQVPDPARAPELRYPADGTLLPLDLAAPDFQLDRGTGNAAARLTVRSELASIDVDTAADHWRPSAQLWSLVASASPAIDVAVIGGNGGSTVAGAASRLSFGPAAGGRITYWSASASSVLSTSLAGAPTTLYPPASDGKCVGCHVASRDGKQLAFGYDGERLRTLDTAGLTPIIDNRAPVGWATFSPAGDLVLVADRGTLTLLDAATGLPVGPNGGVVPLPNGKKGTHPDWSPDGHHVAITLANAIVKNTEVNKGEIALIPYDSGNWGSPQVLVPAIDPRDNNYFPRWSPDGRYLAYVHSIGPSFKAASAELRLISSGGGPPTTLATASHRVGTRDVADLASTMPWWAPGSGDTAWLAFASTRTYGSQAISQIWVAGLDLSRPGDPSFAAFWVPDQGAGTLSNNPVWLPTIYPSPE